MKRILSCALALSLLASTAAIPAYATEENDAAVGIIGGADGPTAIFLTESVLGGAGAHADAQLPLSFDGIAEALYSVGILRGDGVNFNLAEIPDRLQACVMVVRMRGEEAAALAAYEAGETVCPFTDVGDDAAWAKPYLAWLYEKKIMLGIGDGKFGNTECTAQMYVTFMLRALGYADVVGEGEVADFSFAEALQFAYEKTLWDDALAGEDAFTRGSMAAVTYQTLAAERKSGADKGERLLSALVSEGSVARDMAQPILDRFADVDRAKALYDISAEKSTTAVSSDISYVILAKETDGVGAERVTTMQMDLQTAEKTEGGLPVASAVTGALSLHADGMMLSLPIGMWLSEGALYTDLFGEKTVRVLPTDADFAAQTDLIGASTAMIDENGVLSALMGDTVSGILPYYAYSDIAVTEENGMTTVSYDITDLMLEALAEMIGTDGTGMIHDMIPSVTATVVYDAEGMIAEMTFGMYQYLSLKTEEGATVAYEYSVDMTANNFLYGDAVAITYPDFSAFVPAE